jgi:hypothetical protein
MLLLSGANFSSGESVPELDKNSVRFRIALHVPQRGKTLDGSSQILHVRKV